MHAMDAGHRGATRRSKQGMRGVTLIELLVVVTILGILVAIAYPGYQGQMQRTRRADGKAALLNAAQALERCFTRFNVYNDVNCAILDDLVAGTPSLDGWYVVTDTLPAATSYALIATAQGAQVNDAQCVNLTLNNRGIRGASGTLGADCW